MRFLMLVCRDESIAFSRADRGRIGPQVQAWVSEMEQRGVRLQGDVLEAVDATTNVRVRGGKTELDTGPRVETNESDGTAPRMPSAWQGANAVVRHSHAAPRRQGASLPHLFGATGHRTSVRCALFERLDLFK